MLGFYNYTVWLTYAGLTSAVIGLFMSFSGNPRAAVICLLISGCCDMFDGKIARTKKDRTEDEKNFGIQIDSLCDVVCFGVLPAVIGFSIGAVSWWQVIIAAGFVLCGVIRLGYFNVTEETRQTKTTEKRKTYNGMPITSSAMLVPLLMCFSGVLGALLPVIYSVLLAVCAILFIAPFSVRKPGKWGGIVFLVVGAVICALILILK